MNCAHAGPLHTHTHTETDLQIHIALLRLSVGQTACLSTDRGTCRERGTGSERETGVGPVDTSPHTGQEPIWQRRERLFGMKSKSKHLQNYAHKSFNTFVADLDAALGVARALQGLLKLAHFRPGCTAGCLCLVYTLHALGLASK